MKNIASTLLLLLFGSQAWAGPSDTITTASGLKYIKHGNVNAVPVDGKKSKAKKEAKPADGIQPLPGDRVKVHYTGKFLSGKVFDSSVERGEPFSFVLGKGQVIRGWDEGIALLKTGDSATFIIPSELAYGSSDRGSIPPNSTLVFEVKLVGVSPTVHPLPYIDAKKPVKMTKTASGLEYAAVKENPKGRQPKTGDTVEVHYTGYLTDGKIFDSSVERGETFSFRIGIDPLIPGWVEGVMMMHAGEKYRFVIPAALAYGDKGAGQVIPPGATIIFDVELVSVK